MKTVDDIIKPFVHIGQPLCDDVCKTCPFRRDQVSGESNPLKFSDDDARAFIHHVNYGMRLPTCHKTGSVSLFNLSNPAKLCRGAVEFRRGGNSQVVGSTFEFFQANKNRKRSADGTMWHAGLPHDWPKWKDCEQDLRDVVSYKAVRSNNLREVVAYIRNNLIEVNDE